MQYFTGVGARPLLLISVKEGCTDVYLVGVDSMRQEHESLSAWPA